MKHFVSKDNKKRNKDIFKNGIQYNKRKKNLKIYLNAQPIPNISSIVFKSTIILFATFDMSYLSTHTPNINTYTKNCKANELKDTHEMIEYFFIFNLRQSYFLLFIALFFYIFFTKIVLFINI